jgi:HAD superfamily hydrolase (TIGR01490 family)
MKPVAFFDIDGTLFRSSLLVELVDALIAHGVFPASVRTHYLTEKEAWQNREGTYDAYIGGVIDAFLSHLKGVHYGTLADVGKSVVAAHQKRVYRYTRDLVKQLAGDGYTVIAISQSPKTILDTFCKEYGFDKVYGRIYEIGPQDRFTGQVSEEHIIENKAKVVDRVLERHADLTLRGSIAVGDTDGDIPLLEKVERPICFNPNQALFDEAVRRGWEVVVERKDVIYEWPRE